MAQDDTPAKVATSAELGAWLPIATAPRNGDIFLAYRRGEMRDSWAMQREDGVVWNFGGSSFHERWNPAQVPTHWRPMLAPPEAPNVRGEA